MKDYNTVFPDYIDDRYFFQDISIDKLPIMEKFNSMIRVDAYTSASEYINAQDVTFYGAWVLNMLEDRLIAIETYLLDEVDKPDLVCYSDTEPTGVDVGYCWT